MKRIIERIIDGKKYDTETADQVGEYEYRRRGDFNWYYEGLYRTKNGAWFLAGEGGPRSKYGEQVDQSSWEPGEGLQVLSESEARDWLETWVLRGLVPHQKAGDVVSSGGCLMVVGTLLGYLPEEGVMEIRTGAVVQTFSVSGEVRERLNREPGYYVEWIGKPVKATINRRKVAELDRIWDRLSITNGEPE